MSKLIMRKLPVLTAPASWAGRMLRMLLAPASWAGRMLRMLLAPASWAAALLLVAGGCAPGKEHPVDIDKPPVMLHDSVYGGELYMPGFKGDVDLAANGFDPAAILTDFDSGQVSKLANGQTLREYEIYAVQKTIEIAPGIRYEAWTYNGRVPGPTIRAVEGDRIRVHFINNTGHPHTMHFHGIHPGNMDGVYESVAPGADFTYEFDAEPAGLHEYHCHIMPLAEHISRGLYGVYIVEPREGWPEADHEFVMVMNGLDLDFDQQNDLYAVNFIPFYYDKHPVKIKTNEKIRVFLVNMLEFDPVNSFHLHANFFYYYPTGTSRTPAEYTDTVMQMQAQRGILEFTYEYPGNYMFHAHKTEFAELGWTGIFQVEEE